MTQYLKIPLPGALERLHQTKLELSECERVLSTLLRHDPHHSLQVAKEDKAVVARRAKELDKYVLGVCSRSIVDFSENELAATLCHILAEYYNPDTQNDFANFLVNSLPYSLLLSTKSEVRAQSCAEAISHLTKVALTLRRRKCELLSSSLQTVLGLPQLTRIRKAVPMSRSFEDCNALLNSADVETTSSCDGHQASRECELWILTRAFVDQECLWRTSFKVEKRARDEVMALEPREVNDDAHLHYLSAPLDAKNDPQASEGSIHELDDRTDEDEQRDKLLNEARQLLGTNNMDQSDGLSDDVSESQVDATLESIKGNMSQPDTGRDPHRQPETNYRSESDDSSDLGSSSPGQLSETSSHLNAPNIELPDVPKTALRSSPSVSTLRTRYSGNNFGNPVERLLKLKSSSTTKTNSPD